MEYRDNEAIYLQIANNVSESILRRKWVDDDKIPSVRDMASEMQVNPNTIIRTYEFLESREIIYTKRGLGFFVSAGAIDLIIKYKKEYFLEAELPSLFKNMTLLDIEAEEIVRRYKLYQNSKS